MPIVNVFVNKSLDKTVPPCFYTSDRAIKNSGKNVIFKLRINGSLIEQFKPSILNEI